MPIVEMKSREIGKENDQNGKTLLRFYLTTFDIKPINRLPLRISIVAFHGAPFCHLTDLPERISLPRPHMRPSSKLIWDGVSGSYFGGLRKYLAIR